MTEPTVILGTQYIIRLRRTEKNKGYFGAILDEEAAPKRQCLVSCVRSLVEEIVSEFFQTKGQPLTLLPRLLRGLPPCLLPSLPPSLLLSLLPSLSPSLPPSLFPSLPPNLLPSLLPRLLPSLPLRLLRRPPPRRYPLPLTKIR